MHKVQHGFIIISIFLLFYGFSVINTYAADYEVVYDPFDATINIQDAINKASINPGLDRVILRNLGTWITGPIKLDSDIELVLDDGVILEAKSGAFGDNGSASTIPLILIERKSNVKITGYNATIRMLINEYTTGEWRHCISVRRSDNVTIKGVTLQKSGGDGIYLGSDLTDVSKPNTNILIENVVCDGNARNGISIISVKNATIINSKIINTGQYNPSGLASGGPYAGIDIEPNNLSEVLQDINVINCRFEDNKRYGINFNLDRYYNQTLSPAPTTVKVSGCVIRNTVFGFRLINAPTCTSGSIDIKNCTIENTNTQGIFIVNWSKNIGANFKNCTLINPSKSQGGMGAIEIGAWDTEYKYDTGNISLSDIYVIGYDSPKPYPLRILGVNNHVINNVTGMIYTEKLDTTIDYRGDPNLIKDVNLKTLNVVGDLYNIHVNGYYTPKTNGEESFTMITAVYTYSADGFKKLYNIKTKDGLTVNGLNAVITDVIPIPLPTENNRCWVEVFIWDSITSMKSTNSTYSLTPETIN